MGSCVSLYKGSDSAMKLNLSVESKDENFLIPSPVKDTVKAGDRAIAGGELKSHWSPPRFRDVGSKDEAFFDSQPWLESDCEDDFFSVNGDFTPSRGSTPVHHSFSLANLRMNKAPVVVPEESPGSGSETSPQDKKKRLSELFQESLRLDDESNSSKVDKNELPGKTEAEANGSSLRAKSRNGSPYLPRALSEVSSEKTPNGYLKSSEEKSSKSAQCCLPRLRSSFSFSEKKGRMSPAHSVG